MLLPADQLIKLGKKSAKSLGFQTEYFGLWQKVIFAN